MPLIDELERLTQMHASGALTDAEFAAAKTALLSGQTSTSNTTTNMSVQHQTSMTSQFVNLQRQQALLRVDQDWQVEREQYLMRGRVPTIADGLVVSGICVVMVVGLILLAWQFIESLIGYILILAIVEIGVSCYQWYVVYQYSVAEAEYHERRRKVEKDSGRR